MRPRVALLPWGDVFEDWLDPLGVTPEQLRDEVTGSWMFGYVDALRTAGADTVLVCFTSRVPTRPAGSPAHRGDAPPGANGSRLFGGVPPHAPGADRRQARSGVGSREPRYEISPPIWRPR